MQKQVKRSSICAEIYDTFFKTLKPELLAGQSSDNYNEDDMSQQFTLYLAEVEVVFLF
jgi:hypothetical protein